MRTGQVTVWSSIFILTTLFGSSSAQQKSMTGAELSELLGAGKTISLGGPGEGYTGTLTLNPDGTGLGTAKTDEGKQLTLTGTWRVRGDSFCRQWNEFDFGFEICETWVRTAPTKVDVLIDGVKIGVNHW